MVSVPHEHCKCPIRLEGRRVFSGSPRAEDDPVETQTRFRKRVADPSARQTKGIRLHLSRRGGSILLKIP